MANNQMIEEVQGQQTDTTAGNEFNTISFIAQQILGLISTAKVVRVVACTNDGGVSPVGFVDVQPLVTQVDGEGKTVPHGVVFNLPYSRLQGGTSAVILDPAPGDIGVAVFADRDISNVKATRDTAPPGSFRRYAIADGIYLGMVLNAAPEQYVQFSAAGISLVSPTAINLQAPAVTVNATTFDVTAATVDVEASTSATLNSPANTIAGGNTSVDGKGFLGHHHGGVQPGGSNTGGVT
jgi:hypothetical protein